MKKLIQIAEELDSVLTNTSIASCFLLAIQQKEYAFAFELVCKIKKWNPTLIYNLKAIVLCKLNRISEAFFCIETLLIDVKKSEDFKGTFFPLTVIQYNSLFTKFLKLKF
jgi:hypothetical protein